MENSGWTTVTRKSPKGPKTRAMRKKAPNNRESKELGSRMVKLQSKNKINNDKAGTPKIDTKKLREIQEEYKNEGNKWSEINYVEQNTKYLEEQLQLAKTQKTKNEIKKLIDIYEKRLKYLNLEMIERKRKEKHEIEAREVIEIEDDNEKGDEDDKTIMSDITIKTNNSVMKGNKITPQKLPNYTPEKHTETNKAKLEFIGKTRRAETKEKQEKEKENKKENEYPNEQGVPEKKKERNSNQKSNITQDDGTIMSEVTNGDQNDQKHKNKNSTEEKIEGVQDEDEISIISEVTMKPTEEKENKEENKKEDEKKIEPVKNPYIK